MGNPTETLEITQTTDNYRFLPTINAIKNAIASIDYVEKLHNKEIPENSPMPEMVKSDSSDSDKNCPILKQAKALEFLATEYMKNEYNVDQRKNGFLPLGNAYVPAFNNAIIDTMNHVAQGMDKQASGKCTEQFKQQASQLSFPEEKQNISKECTLQRFATEAKINHYKAAQREMELDGNEHAEFKHWFYDEKMINKLSAAAETLSNNKLCNCSNAPKI